MRFSSTNRPASLFPSWRSWSRVAAVMVTVGLATVVVTATTAGQAQAAASLSRCSKVANKAALRYTTRILKGGQVCYHKMLKLRDPANRKTVCRESQMPAAADRIVDVDEAKYQALLDKVNKLSSRRRTKFRDALLKGCLGIAPADLGFPPSACPPATDEAAGYTFFDFEACVVLKTEDTIADLFDATYPDLDRAALFENKYCGGDTNRSCSSSQNCRTCSDDDEAICTSDSVCINAGVGLCQPVDSTCQRLEIKRYVTCQNNIARRSSMMLIREFKARMACLLANDSGQRCRDEVDGDRGLETGNVRTDRKITRAHLSVLGGVAGACPAVGLSVLGFPGACAPYHPEGSVFTMAALKDCLFDIHHLDMIRFLDIMNPDTSLCGTGDAVSWSNVLTDSLDFLEECDDGAGNSNLKGAYCHADCRTSLCGDADGSGTIDFDDVQRIASASNWCDGTDCSSGQVRCDLEVCDTNGDGNITIADALLVFGTGNLLCRCGDGLVGPREQCDDGNDIDGDGCENDCSPSP